MNSLYFECRGYDLTEFWRNVCRDKEVRDLVLKPIQGPQGRYTSLNLAKRTSRQSQMRRRMADIQKDPGVRRLEKVLKRAEVAISGPRGGSKSSSSSTTTGCWEELPGESLIDLGSTTTASDDLPEDCWDDSDGGIFATGQSHGTKEMAGQRVLQVATIVRNLSFEEDNARILAQNLTCLRYIILFHV